jgi:hypothetical protein
MKRLSDGVACMRQDGLDLPNAFEARVVTVVGIRNKNGSRIRKDTDVVNVPTRLVIG